MALIISHRTLTPGSTQEALLTCSFSIMSFKHRSLFKSKCKQEQSSIGVEHKLHSRRHCSPAKRRLGSAVASSESAQSLASRFLGRMRSKDSVRCQSSGTVGPLTALKLAWQMRLAGKTPGSCQPLFLQC